MQAHMRSESVRAARQSECEEGRAYGRVRLERQDPEEGAKVGRSAELL